ncbi:response regulator [Neptuniibacter halophilus]|uniref:response regulator n=1 Tax=Neptuniibacter halophilus TaxID=651666 RepID=UPI0025727DB6|nr:response regulator [Neptuniibacter halophilus]
MDSRKIIILDDEEMMLRSLERRFKTEARNYDVHCFTSVKAALAELEQGECYAFISDVKMPLLSGDQVITYISQKYPEQACLVITGQAEREEIRRIVQAGNVGSILLKPLEFDKLLEALENISAPAAEPDAEG